MRKQYFFLFFIFSIIIFHSCKIIEYPINKQYNYKYKINVVGDYSLAEKKILQENLEKQVDDSLTTTRVRIKRWRFFPGYKTVYHSFDINSITRTKDFFKASYVANGYFRGGITTYTIDTNKNIPFRSIVTFNVFPYQNHKIDTIVYSFSDSTLQALAANIKDRAVVHKNDYYTQDNLDAERKRIADEFRNNGYLKFSKEDIKIVVDTINTALFKNAEDPLEQLQLLEEAANFNNNPNTDITYTLKDSVNRIKLKKYYIGNVYINTDNIEDEIKSPYSYHIKNSNITKQFFIDNYKNNVFTSTIFLKKGDLFSQIALDKTTNALNYLGPWQQVIITAMDSTMRGDTIDFKILMLPYKKFLSDRKLEGSVNQNTVLNIGTRLYGIGLSQTIKNRNFSREAIQSTFIANANVEFGNKTIINSFQGGLNYNLNIPRFPKFLDSLKISKKFKFEKAEQRRSFINANANYTERIDFLTLWDFGISAGIQWTRKSKQNNNEKSKINKSYKGNYNQQLTFPNIEFKILRKLKDLDSLIRISPFYALAFADGFVNSIKYNLNRTNILKESIFKKSNSFISLGLEISYLPKGFKTFDDNLFSFVKIDLEKKWNIIRPSHSWAIRGLIGFGYTLNKSLKQNEHLPFFRQYISGGPNNMRAWGVRSINSYSTRITNNGNQDFYFGDIQAEANVEYRFKYGKFLGSNLYGAHFLDIGNIWNITPADKNAVPTNISNSQKIINDIGVGVGTGFRYDIAGYFVIRVDFAMKLKEPQDINGRGGFLKRENFTLSPNNLKNLKLQLGINYPF
jgi:outer membrane protein insertion porin family